MRYSAAGCVFNVNESTGHSEEKEEEIHWSVHVVAVEGAEVTSTVHDAATEKTEK